MLLCGNLGANTGKEKYTWMRKSQDKRHRKRGSQGFHKCSNPMGHFWGPVVSRLPVSLHTLASILTGDTSLVPFFFLCQLAPIVSLLIATKEPKLVYQKALLHLEKVCIFSIFILCNYIYLQSTSFISAETFVKHFYSYTNLCRVTPWRESWERIAEFYWARFINKTELFVVLLPWGHIIFSCLLSTIMK